MDINCTHKCVHQKEGKCTLRELNTFKAYSHHGIDCAYFSERGTS
jgi:hypothetical protein